MQKLKTFIDSYGGAALAKKLGVSRGAVSSWRNGRYSMSPALARRVAALSEGALSEADIRPDIFAPLPPEAAAQESAA